MHEGVDLQPDCLVPLTELVADRAVLHGVMVVQQRKDCSTAAAMGTAEREMGRRGRCAMRCTRGPASAIRAMAVHRHACTPLKPHLLQRSEWQRGGPGACQMCSRSGPTLCSARVSPAAAAQSDRKRHECG